MDFLYLMTRVLAIFMACLLVGSITGCQYFADGGKVVFTIEGDEPLVGALDPYWETEGNEVLIKIKSRWSADDGPGVRCYVGFRDFLLQASDGGPEEEDPGVGIYIGNESEDSPIVHLNTGALEYEFRDREGVCTVFRIPVVRMGYFKCEDVTFDVDGDPSSTRFTIRGRWRCI